LDTDEFKGAWVAILLFQAKRYYFPDALHQSVEIPGLGVATVESGNGGDVVAFLVLLNQHGEFSLLLQVSPFAKVYREKLPVCGTGVWLRYAKPIFNLLTS
jgi:hypothetical protein